MNAHIQENISNFDKGIYIHSRTTDKRLLKIGKLTYSIF